jgi:hypothetical protein
MLASNRAQTVIAGCGLLHSGYVGNAPALSTLVRRTSLMSPAFADFRGLRAAPAVAVFPRARSSRPACSIAFLLQSRSVVRS